MASLTPPSFRSVVLNTSAAIAAIAALHSAPSAQAASLINEDWESYAPLPAVVTSPWQDTFGGGTSPTPSTNRVVNETINGRNSNWLLMDNSASDEPVSNPSLRGVFSNETRLNISFTYSIPANYGTSSQIQFGLGNISGQGTTTPAITIILGRNYEYNGMLYNAAGTKHNMGHTFTAGETVTLSLTNIDQISKTYDLAWSSSTGAHNSISQVALTSGSVENWNAIWFGESSNVSSISKIYLDNISVESIPEPSTGALLLGSTAFSLLLLRRRSR